MLDELYIQIVVKHNIREETLYVCISIYTMWGNYLDIWQSTW